MQQPSPQRIPPSVRTVLTQQAHALLASDKAGWLAPVDPADKQLRQRYEWLYSNLRNLHVSRFKPTPEVDASGGTINVEIEVCLASAICSDSNTSPGRTPRTQWRVTFASSTVISGLKIANEQPAPWELNELTFRSGARTTIAATSSLAGLLIQAHREAEAAAVDTDAYATRWPKPPHYIVYLASSQQFDKEYFGGKPDPDLAGYATPGANYAPQYQVVLHTPYKVELPVLMRHELGHAATLTGADHQVAEWITEGIAEHIAYAGSGVNTSPRMSAVKRYVAAGWTGDLTTPAAKGKIDLTRNIRYGLGHLAVDCLVKQHGPNKFLAFFETYARRREPIDDASQAAFGIPWAQENQRCAAEIRRRLR